MMTPYLAFGLPTGAEWLYIVLIILILFGAKKLPELARGLGRSVGEFKKAKDEFDRELNNVKDEVTDVDASKPRQIDHEAEFKKVETETEAKENASTKS